MKSFKDIPVGPAVRSKSYVSKFSVPQLFHTAPTESIILSAVPEPVRETLHAVIPVYPEIRNSIGTMRSMTFLLLGVRILNSARFPSYVTVETPSLRQWLHREIDRGLHFMVCLYQFYNDWGGASSFTPSHDSI